MSDKSSLTRSDLIEDLHNVMGLSKSECSRLLESVVESILDTIVSNGQLKVSSFGTFEVREKKSRIGRNPKTGEEFPIDNRRVLVFKPSKLLVDKINH